MKKKQKKVKALFINAENETITEITLDNKTLLQELYRVIGCSYVQAIHNALITSGILKTDDIWVDGEGRLKELKHYWKLPYHAHPIAGNAVILGYDDKGNCVNHTFTGHELYEIEQQIQFFHV